MLKKQFKLQTLMKGFTFILLSFALFSFKGCFLKDDEDDSPGHAQASKFKVTIENSTAPKLFFQSGAFTIPVGDQTAGPATPGKFFKFSFNAPLGAKLSFATMFGQSNDLFFAPGEDGIMLYDDRNPITADVTEQIKLWDAGTEVNEEPGAGPNQAPRQSSPNTGTSENGVVKEISKVMDGYTYPKVSDVIKVELKHISGSMFEVTIKNVSTSNTLMTSQGPAPAPHSPGVFVIHTTTAPLFKVNEPVRPYGLERIAEDGNPAELAEWVAKNTGYVSPFSPGVWAIHKNDVNPIFTYNAPDYMEGLERIAEDGNPMNLASVLIQKKGIKETGVYSIPVGKSSAAPIMPGEKFEFEFKASHGDRLSFASMLGQSNDIFLSPGDMGIELFNKNGAVTGNVSEKIYLWDAGTEVNEYPGAGMNQAPRQSAPNTGPSESNPVKLVKDVNDGFSYPMPKDIIRVTITATK
jgi:hypothetical protein